MGDGKETTLAEEGCTRCSRSAYCLIDDDGVNEILSSYPIVEEMI